VVDTTGTPQELARLVADITGQKRPGVPALPAPEEPEDDLGPVLEAMRSHFSLDLSYLRGTMLQRRVRRRMALLSISDLPEYVDRLRNDAKEAIALRQDVFIGVTSFFRDPEAFESIKRHLATDLRRRQVDDAFRIWVPACASGEEVYSLAMLTVEAMEACGHMRKVKLFATDIDESALARVSRATYSSSSVADVSPARLARFFDAQSGAFVIKPSLREMVICAQHNLVTAPPFTRIDLVSCRNLLIYFDQAAQEQVLASLHFSLRQGGTLFLGSAEALGRLDCEFSVVDAKQKMYKKTRNVILPTMRRRGGLRDPIAVLPREAKPRAKTRRESSVEEVDLESWLDALVTRYRPQAGAGGVQLNCTCDGGSVALPRGALEEACVNLLENAFRYGCQNDSPRVDVSCRINQGVLELSVRDNGNGIAPENHQKVFEPFRRLDPSLAEGSGVGLVAARRLIGRHGGAITLDSAEGRGAKFMIRVPIGDTEGSLHRRSTVRRRALVVEDDTLDAKAIARSLGDDFEKTQAKDLETATALLDQHRYDVIILDLSLPDGHGLELVRHVRTVMRSSIPIVVVTGHGEGISPGDMTASVASFVAKSELAGGALRSEVANALARELPPAGVTA
jgi:chemotaxis methyl-accepting protein methylase